MARPKKVLTASRQTCAAGNGRLRERLDTEVAARFGVLPNLFRLTPENPEITACLFGFAGFAYLDNPLPSLFKERLFVYLSRFCEVRYCIVRHVGFLMGLGHPADDARSPVNSVEAVIRLVTRPLPHAEALKSLVARLHALSGPLQEMPAPDSELEEALFACATHAYLTTRSTVECLLALRHALGESLYQYLLVFLAFVRTAHYWTKVQSGLRLEEDVEQMLASHERLAQALLNDPSAAASEVGPALMDELKYLRGESRQNDELLRIHQVVAEAKDRLLQSKSAELAERVAELKKLNTELRNSRRAALDLMEDALLSREALWTNEVRMRGQKAALQSALDGAALEEALNVLVRVVAEETDGEARTAFYLVGPDGTRLHPIRGAGDMPDTYLDRMDGFSIGEDSLACGLAVRIGRPVVTRDVFAEPRWAPWVGLAEEYDYRGCWSFPIKTGHNKAVGTFAMYFRMERDATPRDLVLAEIVTQTAAVIISSHVEARERARAEEALREALEAVTRADGELEQRVAERTRELEEVSQAQQALLQRLVTAQEEERLRLSRELDDHLGQQITGLLLELSVLGREPLPDGAAAHVERLQCFGNQIAEEVHQTAIALRPNALDDLGLQDALHHHVQEWSTHTGIPVEMQYTGVDGQRFPGAVKTALYRIVQEALNDVGRHARSATQVSVLLQRSPRELSLIVEDNGPGFDTDTAFQPEVGARLGLCGMRERVELLGGTMTLESEPSQGTTIYVRIPHSTETGTLHD